MKKVYRLFISFFALLAFSACGYHNPNVYHGPEKTVYITEWKNRTSKLGLDSNIYRSLTRWFQKSAAISTVRHKTGADFILAGEIISLALPSLSYGAGSKTSEVKVILKVRYILKEISTNKIVLEAPLETWTEEYLVTATNTASNLGNEEKALDQIIEDLSRKIYQRTLTALPTL